MNIQLTAETFAQQLHNSFVAEIIVEGAEPASHEIELIQVTTHPARPKPTWGRASELPHREQPFSLIFRFPKGLSSHSINCRLSHESGEAIGDFMLSAIDEDSRGRYYEAVFN